MTSLADCDKNRKVMVCPKGLDRCVTLVAEFKVGNAESKYFKRFCSTKAYCNADKAAIMKACEAVKNASCMLECCETDLCSNEGYCDATKEALKACIAVNKLLRMQLASCKLQPATCRLP